MCRTIRNKVKECGSEYQTMQHVRESDSAGTLLDEIRQLFAGDDEGDALDLLDAYLDTYPADWEATLLKIELSLEADRNAGFIGETLPRLLAEHPTSERVQQVAALVEDRVRALLNEGRRELRGRYRRDAHTAFERAMALAPRDPAVPLAAALALLGEGSSAPSDDDDGLILLTLFEGSLARAGETRDGQDPKIETYLRRALEIGPPEHPACWEAAGHLLRQMLAAGRIDQALDLLQGEAAFDGQTPALEAELALRAILGALGRAAGFLRAGQMPIADELLAACADLMPDLPLVHLLQAAARTLSGDTAAALAHYEGVVSVSPDHLGPPSLDRAAALWHLAQAQRLACPHCGKDTDPLTLVCGICDSRVSQHELVIDRYGLDEAPPALIAHIGLAELTAAQGDTPAAIRHLDRALADLPAGHAAARRLRTLRGKWLAEAAPELELEQPAAAALAAWEHDGLTPEVAAQVRYVAETAPAAWRETAPETRHALARALLDASDLALAQMFLGAAFADERADGVVGSLRAELASAVARQVAALTAGARNALADGQPERAMAGVEVALTLLPGDPEALLLRADALLAQDNPLAALSAFHAILDRATDPQVTTAAQLGVARALEARHELAGALAALDGLEDTAANAVRQRLARRQRGEPVVVVRPMTDLVMHDTLERAASAPYHAGYFAVTVGAVRRSPDQPGWGEHLLAASLEFTQVLGGLRHQEGDPLFALRFITRPDPRLPERGSLTIALLVRVSAPDEDACRALALDLWNTLRGILPLAHEFVYGFEPVVDEAALTALLEPFEPATVAEVVRREDVPQENNSRYAVYPFSPASRDLHNLCWTLLRQPAPAMLSVHLLPTDVMPWETAALARVALDEPHPASEEVGTLSVQDPLWAWWHGPRLWSQTQTSRRLVETLRAQAYILGITVMGSAGTSPLLPEMVAAGLFGPFHDDGDGTRGGYEVACTWKGGALASADIGLVMRIGQPTDHFHVTGALIHCMMCALPVLACRLDGIREIVTEGREGLLFDPDSADEFLHQLARLQGDPAGRRSMGQRGRERALAEFNPDAIACQTADTLVRFARLGVPRAD